MAQACVDGLLRNETRPARLAARGSEVAETVVTLMQGDTPWRDRTLDDRCHGRVVPKAYLRRIGSGAASVQPHRIRQFNLSTDPAFATKLSGVDRPRKDDLQASWILLQQPHGSSARLDEFVFACQGFQRSLYSVF